jgi:hypothetical protein
MNLKKLLGIVPFFLIVFSCAKKSDTPEAPQAIEEYYPLATGNYRIYQVATTNYTVFQKHDSVYQLKETVADTFLDAEGQLSYKLIRYKRALPFDTFQLDSVWSAKILDKRKVIVFENNVPFLKLLYPLKGGISWNGNQYNSYSDEPYNVTGFGGSQGSYSSVATIVHRNDTNLLFRDYRVEMFAKDIGLIYKETRTLQFSNSAQDFGHGVITGGIESTQQLVEYGKK